MVTGRFLVSFVALTPANVSAVVACIFMVYIVVSAFVVFVCVFAGSIAANAFLGVACIIIVFTAKDAFARAVTVCIVAQSRQTWLVHGRMHLGSVSAAVSRHAAVLYLGEDHLPEEIIRTLP